VKRNKITHPCHISFTELATLPTDEISKLDDNLIKDSEAFTISRMEF